MGTKKPDRNQGNNVIITLIGTIYFSTNPTARIPVSGVTGVVKV